MNLSQLIYYYFIVRSQHVQNGAPRLVPLIRGTFIVICDIIVIKTPIIINIIVIIPTTTTTTTATTITTTNEIVGFRHVAERQL